MKFIYKQPHFGGLISNCPPYYPRTPLDMSIRQKGQGGRVMQRVNMYLARTQPSKDLLPFLYLLSLRSRACLG